MAMCPPGTNGARVAIVVVTALPEIAAAEEKATILHAESSPELAESQAMQAAMAQMKRTLQLIAACNHIVMRSTDESRLLADICRAVFEFGGYRLAWVGYAQNDAVKSIVPMAIGGPDSEFVAEVRASWAETEPGGDPTGTAICTGNVSIVRDPSTEVSVGPWRELAKKAGYRSALGVPLRLDGKVLGALSIYSALPDAFDKVEINLLKEFGDSLAYGIGVARTRAALDIVQENIRRSEERYRNLVEMLNDGVLVVDEALTITFINAIFARMLGRPESEILGRNSIEFLDEAAKGSIAARIEQLRLGEAERYEVNWLRCDGTPVPTLISSHPSFDSAHRYCGSVSVVTDLSEFKNVEGGRDPLARIVEGAQDGIIANNVNGIVLTWNMGAEKLYGYSAEEMVGQNIEILVPPERKHEAGELIAKVCRGEGVGEYETARITKSGERLHILLTMSPIKDYAGAITGVFTVAHDITGRKRTEEALRDAARYARSLIEAGLDPMFTIGAEGRITDVNEATIHATGVGRDQLIGSDFAGYFTEPDKALAVYREAYAIGRVRDYPLTIRSRTGASIDVLYNATAYRDGSDTIAGVFAVAHDITERKQKDEVLETYRAHLENMVAARTAELAATNASVEGANKELESFAYSVSHDLRTPLRAIDGFSNIILEDYAGKLDDEGRRVLNVIRESTAKMNRMIDDILAFSRVGRTELTAGSVDMSAMVRAAIEDLEPATAGRKVTFEVGDLPAARCDAAMMQHVWANLLDNAVKYTSPNPTAAVQIGATPGHGETVYFVRDDGVGFDMQYASKLFGVFQRLHGAEFPGTGIGLAIVKRIVTRHGGRVWAEGKPGEGATFFFSLPDAGAAHG
jgi:PAS domain S-box-containing protein